MYVYFVCIRSTLSKVISHYDFSVLSTSVIGFQKKLDRGVGGWGERYPVFILFQEFVIPLQSP